MFYLFASAIVVKQECYKTQEISYGALFRSDNMRVRSRSRRSVSPQAANSDNFACFDRYALIHNFCVLCR